MTDFSALDGLVPDALRPRTRKIVLNGYTLPIDIGFHDFEVGNPQRVTVSIEVWVDEASFASVDEADAAWNYDTLRTDVGTLASSRRYNLQETLARAIYDLIAARRGVVGIKVSTCKPDIYPDCEGVGVELSSF